MPRPTLPGHHPSLEHIKTYYEIPLRDPLLFFLLYLTAIAGYLVPNFFLWHISSLPGFYLLGWWQANIFSWIEISPWCSTPPPSPPLVPLVAPKNIKYI